MVAKYLRMMHPPQRRNTWRVWSSRCGACSRAFGGGRRVAPGVVWVGVSPAVSLVLSLVLSLVIRL